MRFHWIDLIAGAAALATLCLQTGDAQQKNASKINATGDWPLYRHDFAGTGYSPLAQITAQNAAP